MLFDEEQHTYLLGDKYLSGITGMLQRQFFPNEFEGIPKDVIDLLAQYGTDVHHSCEDFDHAWINDGTVEVQDYIQICKENNLTHECSEYTVTDGSDWASRIDKVYRVSDDTFDIGDIKTYGVMTADKALQRLNGSYLSTLIFSSYRTRKRRSIVSSLSTCVTSRRRMGHLTISVKSFSLTVFRARSAWICSLRI